MPEETKLSAELFDVFQRYKKATGKVIKWLAIQSGNNDAAHIGQSWSLEDLRGAAEIVKRNAVDVPEDIQYAFQDAIGSRTDISGHFKHSGGDNEKRTRTHEFFTTTRGIFEHLCDTKKGPRANHAVPKAELASDIHMHMNKYHLLESMINDVVSDADQGLFNTVSETTSIGQAKATLHILESQAEAGFSIADDSMNTLFGMYALLVEMDIICSKVKSFWDQAATGAMSTVFATWLTNAAFAHVERSFGGGPWSESLGNADHMEMCAMFSFFMEEMDGHNEPLLPPWITHKSHGIFTSGHGLITPGKTLFAFKQAQNMGIELVKPSLLEKPADHITVQHGSFDGPRQVDSERACLISMLNSVDRLGKIHKSAGALSVRDLNPLVDKIATMTAQDVLKMRTDIAFGLQLLVESYKSFLFINNSTLPNKTNCRLQALKFAGEVKKSVTRVLRMRPPQKSEACKCTSCTEQKLRQGVEFLAQDLASFTSERRFDLCYQAPWVAGSQMLEILSQATDYGLLLCNRMQYVGTALHLYNCMRHIGTVDKESILLEKLCTLLERVIFKGKRPDHNFYSRYAVFLGGKIEFDRNRLRRKKEAQCYDILEGGDTPFHGRDRSWRMAMPAYVDKSQLTIAEHLHFYAIHASKFGFKSPIAGDAWARFYGNRIGNRPVDDKTFVACVHKMYENTFVDTLERMDREVKPECEGDFPIARINWFEVYLTCAEILEKTAILKLKEPTSPYVSGEGESYVSYGVRFTETFLDFADENTTTKRGRQEFPYQASPSIGYFRSAVKSALKGKTTADFVWQI